MPKPLTEKDILGWDVYNWSKAFNYWQSVLRSEEPLECLELGANKGGLSLWLASKGYNVICNDIKPFPPEVVERHKQFEVKGKIRFQNFDAVEIPYENKFDVIVSKSVLGGVGREGKNERIEKAISEIYKALKPGGIFLFAENLAATRLHSFFRKNFVRWAKDWNYMKKEDFEKYIRIFPEADVRTHGFMGAFGFNENSKALLGKSDTMIFNNLPQSWHYIIYGHVKK